MAKPIAITPTLSGKDAETFSTKLEENQNRVLSGDALKKFNEERDRRRANYELFKAMKESEK